MGAAGALLLLAACAPSSEEVADVGEPADGWALEVVRDGLDGPTQVVADPLDGDTVWVAELAGGEDAGAGRVRRVDLAVEGGADAEVEQPQLERLLTPTGVVVLPGASGRLLLVQEQRGLTAVELDAEGDPVDEPGPVGEVLPFNGRSQGTLTAVGGGRVLRIATGTGSGPDPQAGSGVLYATDAAAGPAATTVPVAVGFKNAYAHAVGPDGELYVTEIGDGTYDGEPPPDELNVVPASAWRAALAGDGEPYDGGWPRCTGDQDPTEEFGVTAADCAGLPAPLTTFAPRATPTSVAVTEEGRVLVALWVEGRVVEVDPGTGAVTDVVTGLDGPQHLLARPDGSVLLTVHGTGHLLRLLPPE